jgi:hypothetical protein
MPRDNSESCELQGRTRVVPGNRQESGGFVAIVRIGTIDVGVGDGQVVERQARAIGGIEAGVGAVASALISSAVSEGDYAGCVRGIVVSGVVAVAAVLRDS